MKKNLIVTCYCPFCRTFHEVQVNEKAFDRWREGELIQNAMPDLTPTEREQLISNLCPECQKKVFGG